MQLALLLLHAPPAAWTAPACPVGGGRWLPRPIIRMPLPLGGGGAPSHARRAHLIACAPGVAATELSELKQELFEVLSELPDRGNGAPPDAAADVLEIAGDLAELNPHADWANSPVLAGTWRLLYTSSKVFHANGGVVGYPRDFKGLRTPDLTMRLQSQFRLLAFDETLEFTKGSMVSVYGILAQVAGACDAQCAARPWPSGPRGRDLSVDRSRAQAERLSVECKWAEVGDGMMSVVPRQIIAGSQKFVPRDRQARHESNPAPSAHIAAARLANPPAAHGV